MFRRRWSGLPADPIYANNLAELGYFVNDVDEIRSLDDSNYYFKYFITKNERWNERQRFCFNEAVSKIIKSRLDAENLVEIRLPLGTPPAQPHVPIRISANLPTHSTRVVLIFGQPSQEFGVLAHRVVGGRGGINKGSVVNLVKALKTQQSSATDSSPPGIIIANPGELWWWPEGKRGLTPTGRHAVPMRSAVHYGRSHDPKLNEIPDNATSAQHVKTVFEQVVAKLVNKKAKVDVIAVGDSADDVEGYLNNDEVWDKFGGTLNSLIVMGGYYDKKLFSCEGFKTFMKERGRAYAIHHSSLDNPIAGSGGNVRAVGIPSYGCPTYSAGDASIIEMLLIETQPAVLKWIQDVALQGDAYKNDDFEIFGDDIEGDLPEDMLDQGWGGGYGEKEEVDGEARVDSDESRLSLSSSIAAAEKADEENIVLGLKKLNVEEEK